MTTSINCTNPGILAYLPIPIIKFDNMSGTNSLCGRLPSIMQLWVVMTNIKLWEPNMSEDVTWEIYIDLWQKSKHFDINADDLIEEEIGLRNEAD